MMGRPLNHKDYGLNIPVLRHISELVIRADDVWRLSAAKLFLELGCNNSESSADVAVSIGFDLKTVLNGAPQLIYNRQGCEGYN